MTLETARKRALGILNDAADTVCRRWRSGARKIRPSASFWTTTSSLGLRRRPRRPSPKPLPKADRERIRRISDDPRLPEEIERYRLGIAVTPDRVLDRDLIKTLTTLSRKLDAAGDALGSLPEPAKALLQQGLFCPQAQFEDTAIDLHNVAAFARIAATRIKPHSGPPPDHRLLYAVEIALGAKQGAPAAPEKCQRAGACVADLGRRDI